MEPQTSATETQTDVEVLKKLEDDHLHLQRQVRMIQTDRLQRTMGVHPQFRRQDNLLRTLKMEYVNLIKDLKIARSGAHKKKDKKMKNCLKTSLLFREETLINCDGGVAIMEELDGLLQRNSKEMLKLRELANTCQGEIEARRWQSEGRLISAENKLEVAMLRFNAMQCENRKIREEIEHMLKDRAIFNKAWDKMLTALGKGKKFLSDLFESSTLAYDQRDEWVTKLRSIQEKGKMDQSLQVQEMRDLKKSYDHEMKIYLFLAKKGIIRVNPRQQEKEEERKRIQAEKMKMEYEKHVAILDEITDYTQESCYTKIIDDFLKREQENFSIYKLITDYCAENEVLSREVERLRQDVDDRREWNEMKDIEGQYKLVILDKQVAEMKQKNSLLTAKYEQKGKLTKDIMDKIQDIFKMLDCSLEPFQYLLGDKSPTLHLFDLTMCLITEKIKEYIETLYYFERFMKRSEKTSTSRLKKFMIRAEPRTVFVAKPICYLVSANPCPSCIETRWMARVCETAEEPFNKQQVMEALRALAADPAYVRSDRVHALADCRASASRKLLATRHINF